MLTYFQGHYVEAYIDYQCDFYAVLQILQKSPQDIYRDSDWIFCWRQSEMPGLSQGFVMPTPWQPW